MAKSVRRKWFKMYIYGWLQGGGRVGDYVVRRAIYPRLPIIDKE